MAGYHIFILVLKFGRANEKQHPLLQASSYLAHVEGVGEDEDVWVEVVGGEGEGEDLEIPDDPHPQEEPQVNAHCVHLLRAAAARLARRAGKINLLRMLNILTDS